MLRQKRKQETARDIQRATLDLAIEHGLNNVTTGAIAAAAGVSTRTFFNYFTNKECSAIGNPPGFKEADVAELCGGTGPLAPDLKRFLTAHVAALAKDIDTLAKVRHVVRENPKASAMLDRALAVERQELANCLTERMGDERAAQALADTATNCVARAIHFWEGDQTCPLQSAFEIIWTAHIEASRLLAAPTR